MIFEWDEDKNKLNKIKHRVSFQVAARVFGDPKRIEQFDEGHSEEEDRWITIGMVHPRVLMVVFTERDCGNTVRLISARLANEEERKEYYQF